MFAILSSRAPNPSRFAVCIPDQTVNSVGLEWGCTCNEQRAVALKQRGFVVLFLVSASRHCRRAPTVHLGVHKPQ